MGLITLTKYDDTYDKLEIHWELKERIWFGEVKNIVREISNEGTNTIIKLKEEYHIKVLNSLVLGNIIVSLRCGAGEFINFKYYYITSFPGTTITERDLFWAAIWATEFIKKDENETKTVI